ncbi:ABC transporter ATP-binding protein [Pseudomonas sp. Q1-7]|uniref:ABC transporter ATP-binding protein n=1 Tax=Pseudomonas sp. Q1-7 TaxID=3020843 RepID=UPI00230136AE|nr:ABC transporter ATP-binding protein [Pseudomonas sp. Q1-7]
MTSTEDIVISISGLRKSYKVYRKNIDRLKEALDPRRRAYHKEFDALNGVALSIRRGEVVGILGSNGSGKSTLLKIVAGVLRQSAGKIRVNGSVSALLELGAGFNPEQSGLENIYLAGTLRGVPRKEMSQRLEEIVEFADIGDFIHQKTKFYSSGMFARLAFSVAIHVDPEILIIDEALSVGDAAFKRKCFAKLEEFRKAKKTILLVSHSEAAIVEMCSRAVLIDRGEVLADGPVKETITNYLKLINAKGDKRRQIRDEIVSGQLLSLSGGRTKGNNPDTAAPHKAEESQELYLESLRPQSTVEYPPEGARLRNARIETIQGHKVNRLIHGKRYRYVYDVEFSAASADVSFGMMIKTTQGTALCGGSYPQKGAWIRKVGAGEVRTVTWEFDCLLEEGTYFTNCGVMAERGGERNYLHRILDAYMFQVAPRADRITTAWVNLGLTVRFDEKVVK